MANSETAKWENGELGNGEVGGHGWTKLDSWRSWSRLVSKPRGRGLGLFSVLEAWVSVLVSVSDWRVLGASLINIAK